MARRPRAALGIQHVHRPAELPAFVEKGEAVPIHPFPKSGRVIDIIASSFEEPSAAPVIVRISPTIRSATTPLCWILSTRRTAKPRASIAGLFDRRQSRPALRRYEVAAVCAGLPESASFLKRPDVVVDFAGRFCVEQREILIICDDVSTWVSRSSAEVLTHPVDLSLVRPRPSVKPASK